MSVTNFDVEPFSVLPGLNAINQGVDASFKRKEAEKEKRVQTLQQQQLMKAVESGDPDQIFEYVSNNPGSEKLAGELAGFVSKTTRQSAIATAEKVLLGEADPGDAMLEHVTTVLREGGNAPESRAIAEAVINDPSIAQDQALRTLALHAPEKYKAYREAIGEGDANLPSGTREFNTLVDAAGGDDNLRSRAARIELGLDQRAGTGAAPQVVDVGGVPHIFDRNKQKLVVAKVDGDTVTTDTVAESEGKIASTKKAMESSIAMSNKAMEQLAPIRTKLANYDDAIRALEEGAETGAVVSLFPSFKSASIELDNIRGQMGLDVIGGTTFGALSESELAFALDTALPNKLNGPELKAWLVRKKAVQEKLSKELESAAIYLGKPGNSPAGYLEFRRNSVNPEELKAAEVNDLVNKYAQ